MIFTHLFGVLLQTQDGARPQMQGLALGLLPNRAVV